MDDRRARAEAAAVREQLDRAHAVLREALLDLAWLLVRVHVERQAVLPRVASELLEPVPWARADGVGGDRDRDPLRPERLELGEVGDHRVLAHPREPAARVRGVDADEPDARLLCRFRCRERGLEAEVVELPDRREARGAHLPVGRCVERPDALRGLALRIGQHPVPPGPEVTSCGATAKRPLEGVAVSVDEALERAWSRHGRPD